MNDHAGHSGEIKKEQWEDAMENRRQASIVQLYTAQLWNSMWGGVPLNGPALVLTVHNPCLNIRDEA